MTYGLQGYYLGADVLIVTEFISNDVERYET